MREASGLPDEGAPEVQQIYNLLDKAWGIGGWSCSLEIASVRPAAVACTLEIEGVKRSGVGEGENLTQAATAAIWMAAQQAGIHSPTPHPGSETASRQAKPSAQELIDKLLAKLREAGKGREAAALIVKYGGYGIDPETTRKLYGELRALLIEKGSQ